MDPFKTDNKMGGVGSRSKVSSSPLRQLHYNAVRGETVVWGYTAMSGAQLFCTPFLSNYPTFEEPPLESWRDDLKIKPQQYITSAVGEFGEWMEWITCPDGLAVGFQLRSEPYQGGGLHRHKGNRVLDGEW
jgi:hypothetical protein